MRTNTPEKLGKIVSQIKESGSAALTRLTVLKKWFEQSDKRLPSFAVFIAKRASTSKEKTEEAATALFREARALLKGVEIYDPQIPRKAAEDLYHRLKAFQNEYKNLQWGAVRIIYNRNPFLIEEGLRIYLWYSHSPSDGYRLAAQYCEHYDPRYGDGLSGPSSTRINDIVRFVTNMEEREDARDQ